MDIGSVGNDGGNRPPQDVRAREEEAQPQRRERPNQRGDSLELSLEARRLIGTLADDALKKAGDSVRPEARFSETPRYREILKRIESGFYGSAPVIEAIAERLSDEFIGESDTNQEEP
jgi:hypothetical protein